MNNEAVYCEGCNKPIPKGKNGYEGLLCTECAKSVVEAAKAALIEKAFELEDEGKSFTAYSIRLVESFLTAEVIQGEAISIKDLLLGYIKAEAFS